MSFTYGGCAATGIIFILDQLSQITWKPVLDKEGFVVDFGIAIGNNGVILKSQGRDTINFQPKTSGTTQNLNDVAIRSSGGEEILVVGNNGTIVRSLSFGNTWSVVTPVTSANLNAVCFDLGGSSRQLTVGDNGIILRGTNFGANWTVIASGTSRKLLDVSLNSSDREFAVVVGEKGTILRSTNYGLNWINVSLTDTTINLYSINPTAVGLSEITPFYICGSQGRIYKSTDYGATWVLKNSGTSNTLRSIYFTTDDSGAVTGENGTVRMTTNGGDSWFTDTYFSNVTGNITSISQMPRSSRTFTALSNNNTLYFASEDTNIVINGINQISTEVPKEFSLSQNYPNPFNPKTNINLDLIKSGFVKLVVYDVSGKEVETLVSQYLKAGTYKIDWDGSKHSSGIYFYKIFTDDFIQTKKMVLVK